MSHIDRLKKSWRQNLPVIGEKEVLLHANQTISRNYGHNSRIWHILVQINNKQDMQAPEEDLTSTSQQLIIQKECKVQTTKQKQQQIYQIKEYLNETDLQLNYDLNNQVDLIQLYVLTKYYLQYPIESKVKKHIRANLLGEYDIYQLQRQKEYDRTQKIKDICQCCSLPIQQKCLTEYSLQKIFGLINLSSIKNIGVSTNLFFSIHIMLVLMFMLLLVFYCSYMSIINLISYFQSPENSISKVSAYTFSNFIISVVQLGSLIMLGQQKNQNTYQYASYLWCFVLVLWLAIFIYYKKMEINVKQLTYQKYSLASTYTLYFKNFPLKMTAKELQKRLESYFSKFDNLDKNKLNYIKLQANKLKETQLNKFRRVFTSLENKKSNNNLINSDFLIKQQWKNQYEYQLNNNVKLGIVQKINKARLLFFKKQSRAEQIKLAKKRIKQIRQYFKKLIKYRQIEYNFSPEDKQQHRHQKYKQFRRQINTIEELKNFRQDDQDLRVIQQQKMQAPTFVTFTNRWLLQQFLLCHKKQKFTYNFDPKNVAIVQQPPQPQDIMWQNIGQSQSQLFFNSARILLLSLYIITLSFGLLHLLTEWQYNLENQNDTKLQTFLIEYVKGQRPLFSREVIPYILLAIIFIFKQLVKYTLYCWTKVQKHSTHSDQQASIAFKTVIALFIFSTLVPLVVSLTKSNLFGPSSLAIGVFYLSIMNLVSTVLIKIVDVSKLGQILVRKCYKYDKFSYTQSQYNQKVLNLKKKNYQIGYEYVELVDTFLFTCFYASLQPWICYTGTFYYILTTFYRKYYLVKYCKRPIPENQKVHRYMRYCLMFGPLLFMFGIVIFTSKSRILNPFILPNYLGFVLSICFILSELFISSQSSIQTENSSEIYYQNYVNKMIIDYDMKNPDTSAVSCFHKYRQRMDQNQRIERHDSNNSTY